MLSEQVKSIYRQERARQAALAVAGQGSITTYANSGKVEVSYAAPYGEHAVSALIYAKRRVAMARLHKEQAKATAKRSKAALKGWKTRRAA